MTDTRPCFLGGQYTSKINMESQHLHGFIFSKERGDRTTVNSDCKQLFKAKIKMKKKVEKSILDHVQEK